MLITKETLNALRSSKELTIVKRSNGITYLICKDIYIASLSTKIDKEYVIEARSKYPSLYVTFYLTVQENIKTLLSFLRVNDVISIALKDCPMDDDLKLIEIHMLIERNNKGKEKYYDFLLDVTTEKYL
jgi:hypothetical protein